MTILPTRALPVASSPAVVAGGNAAADNQSPDSFGSLVTQLAGGATPSVPSRARVAPGKGDETDPVEDAHTAPEDSDDQPFAATALPAWLWMVNEPARNLPLPSSSEKPAGDSPNDSATQIDATSAAGAAMPGAAGAGTVATVVFPSLQPLADASAAGSKETAPQGVGSQPMGDDRAVQTPALTAGVVVSAPSPSSTPETDSTAAAPSGTTAAPGGTTEPPAAARGATDSLSSMFEQGASASAPPVARGAAANPGTPSAKSAAAGVADNPIAPSAAPSGRGSSAAGAPPVSASPIEKARAAAKAALDNALRGKDAAAASDTRPAVATAPQSAQPTTAARDQTRQDSASSFAEAGKQAALDMLQNATAPVSGGAAAETGAQFEHSVLSSIQGLALGHEASLDKTLAAAVPVMAEGATRGAVIDDASLHKQMVQAIQLQTRQGGGEATLTLQPEYLGDVTIALRVEQGVVTAHVSAATSEVRTWLTANEAVLRDGLREQGLTLERLVVSDEPAADLRKDGQSRRERDQAPPDEQPRQRPRRETGTFEITV